MFKDPSGLKGEFPCPGLPCEGYGGSADGVKAFNNDGSENITNKPKTTPSGGGTGENPVGAPTIQSTQEHVNRFNREFHEDLGRTRESVGNDMPGVGELFTGMSGSDYRGSGGVRINGNGARTAGNGNAKVNNPSNVQLTSSTKEQEEAKRKWEKIVAEGHGLKPADDVFFIVGGIFSGLRFLFRAAFTRTVATTAVNVTIGGFNFTRTAAAHMDEAGRMIPVQILDDVIKAPMHVLKDTQGTNALMYYSQMWKNSKFYNVEVLYDKATNTIMHFMYTQRSIGPLQAIPK